MSNTTHHLVSRRAGRESAEQVCEYCGKTRSELEQAHGTAEVTSRTCPLAPSVKWVEEAVTE